MFDLKKSKSDQAALSATYGARILEFYEDFFHTKYPLNKTDMAALPDFTYGAMENWGLIVYRESALLYKPGVSDANAKERVITVSENEALFSPTSGLRMNFKGDGSRAGSSVVWKLGNLKMVDGYVAQRG